MLDLSFAGLITESWDYTFTEINPDQGYAFVALANSKGLTIPAGITTVFNMTFNTGTAECLTGSYMRWDTTLMDDPARALLFADVNNYDLLPGFDYLRDSTTIPGYLPGDFDGNQTCNIADLTGLVIVVSGQWSSGMDGTPLTAESFETILPSWGKSMVSLGLVLFAFSTIISWSYYGEKGIEYILGRKSVLPYKWIYLIFLPLGAALQLKLVWTFADIANGLMALPNLIALVGLSGVVAAATKKYFREPFQAYYGDYG